MKEIAKIAEKSLLFIFITWVQYLHKNQVIRVVQKVHFYYNKIKNNTHIYNFSRWPRPTSVIFLYKC